MQTQKSKASPIEVPLRTSPITPRTARQTKTPGSGSEQVSASPNKANRVNKDRSPKVVERKLPQSPISEVQKKRQTKASDLESQIAQLKEDLKKTRDQMVSSELLKEQAELEAEDAKKQLSAMTTKLADTEKQLMEKHCANLAEPSCALNGIHKPNLSADQISHADSVHNEFHSFQSEHEKAAAMVGKLEAEIGECNKSEAQVLEKLNNTQSKLDAAMEENETLKLDHLKASSVTDTIASELEESKAKVNALEILVSKLQSDLVICGYGKTGLNEQPADDSQHCRENGQSEEMEQLKSVIMNLKYEDCKLKAALESAEIRCQELRLQSTLDVQSVYEQVESTNLKLKSKEAELQKAHSEIKELQARLAEKETRFTALEDALSEKDDLLLSFKKENDCLKKEVQKATDGSVADNLIEARVAEQNAISKFEYLTEESDKNSKRTARVIEQLDAAQASNAELEAELRKLKVQSDQWRKAAESAAAMLTSGNNGKYIDRAGSLDSGYHTLGGRISSPFSDDMNDESVKKKNGNMLKKIGVLWKKGQNQK